MSLMIDRVFISVLLLSISGFVFCAVFLPFEKFAYRLTSAKTMVTMNTAALFSFVIPFYIIASVFDGSEKMFTTKNLLVFEDTEAFETYTGILRDTYIIENLKYIWLAGVIIFLAYHIFAYVNFLSKLKSDGFYLNAKIWKDCFNRLKDKNNVPRVELIGCCNIFTPCTVGIKSKKIVIPATMIGAFDAEEIEFILMHEFYHVAHNDLPRKLLIIILNSLNWFNPLFYFLRGNLSDWQEAACDDAVTSGFNKRERTKYCRLLIKVPELENEISKGRTFGINFGGNGVENYKRRISRIMNKNSTNSKFGKVIVTSVAMLAMVSGSVVAKAADTPVNQVFSKNTTTVSSEDTEIIDGKNVVPDNCEKYSDEETRGNFVQIDLQNTDTITYEIIYDDSISTFATGNDDIIEPNHLHKYTSVTVKQHEKHSDGSCTTTYYDGDKCTVCGAVWRGDKISETTYVKCPH